MGHTKLTPDEFRERALQAARNQMERGGPAGVRLTVIAREMGVTHAALYSHFDSRDALIDAVVAQWLIEDEAYLDSICDTPGDPRAKLDLWFAERYRCKRRRALDEAEIYAGFDMAAARNKASVQSHLTEMDRQLAGLLEPLGIIDSLLRQHLTLAMASFLHPTLMLLSAHQDREGLMLGVLDTMLAGMLAKRL